MLITIQYRKEHLIGFKDGEIQLEVSESDDVAPLFIKAQLKKNIKTKFVYINKNLNIYVE